MAPRSVVQKLQDEDGIFEIPNQFKVYCKGTDFKYRLSLPPEASLILGEKNESVVLQVGEAGIVCRAEYEYRIIGGRSPIRRLYRGWGKMVDLLEVSQGDTVHFKVSARRRTKFHVTVEKNDDFTELTPEVVPKPHIIKMEPEYVSLPY